MTRRSIAECRILVTGATSGIGRALALALADERAGLVLTGRREPQLASLVEECRNLGAAVETVAGDITDPATREELLRVAQERFGGIDVLVNNAGVGATGNFEDASPERLRQIMEVNFFAPVEMIRAALPTLMRGRRPMIVNISSVLGHNGMPGMSEYCASKFALHGFSESLRAELTKPGIDVLIVSPGTTESEFFMHLVEEKQGPDWRKFKAVPAEKVAKAIVNAIRRGRHEIIPNTSGRLLCLLARVSPAIRDRVIARLG